MNEDSRMIRGIIIERLDTMKRQKCIEKLKKYIEMKNTSKEKQTLQTINALPQF